MLLRPASVALVVLLFWSPLAGGGLGAAAPSVMGIRADLPERLGRLLGEAIEKGDAPGAVLLVMRRGKVVVLQAHGHRALDPRTEEMTIDTVFDAASLTKVLATATALMILVEEGRLALTDPLSRHLPDCGSPTLGSLTLLELATHYSGLRPSLDQDDEWRGYETAVGLVCAETPVALAGDRFIYSDINYILLGEVIRRVADRPFDEFVRERIFEPLGMNDTRFLPEPSLLTRIAPSERRDGLILRGMVHDPTAHRMGGVAGHAGVFSTASDLAIFLQMILNGGEYGGVRLLSPLSVHTMTTNQSPPGKIDWRGIGFDIRTRFSTVRGDLFPIGSFGHTGFTGTSFWIDPLTETFVVLLTSRLHPGGRGNVVSLRKSVASMVAASILDLPTLLPKPLRGLTQE